MQCWINKRVVVLGLGRSGKPTALALQQAGAIVYAWDDSEISRLDAFNAGIQLHELDSIDWSTIDELILSPGIPHTFPSPHPMVLKAKSTGLTPVGDIEIFCRLESSAKLVAVTGTNGKSTTSALVSHMLNQCNITTALGGNIGVGVFDLPRLVHSDFYVLELSSFQLELSPSLNANVAILLNITEDHLERHGGMDGYINAKKLIFNNKGRSLKAIISVDDIHCNEIYSQLLERASKSNSKGNDYQIVPISVQRPLEEGIYVLEGILTVQLRGKRSQFDLKHLTSLRGIHNHQNIAAAVGALWTLGFDADRIYAGIQTFPGLAHRQERVGITEGVSFINDSKATNVSATERALATFSADGATIYWIAGGKPKGDSLDPLFPYLYAVAHCYLIGEAAEKFCSSLIQTGLHCTMSGVLETACQQAFDAARLDKKSNPVVLLSPACASFDQFRNFEARGDIFRAWVSSLSLARNET